MKRTTEHETDAAGNRLCRKVFEEFGWTVNEIQHDYGADFEVEIFNGGLTTGATFRVQLKSTQAPDYLADGVRVAYSLRADRGKYLAHELRVPAVLVVCDVIQERVFWAMPQLNSSFAAQLETLDDAQTLTIHCRVSDELPGARSGFMNDLTKADALLSARATKRAAAHILADVEPDPVGLISAYQAHIDTLRLGVAYERAIQGDLVSAFAHVDSVVLNPTSSTDAKFRAWLVWEVAEQSRQIESGGSDRDRTAIASRVSSELKTITMDGPPYLRYFAAVYSLASNVSVLAHEGHALLMAERAALHFGLEPFRLARQQWERRLHRAVARSARIVDRVQRTKDAGALPIPISRLVMALGIAGLTLKLDDQVQEWEALRTYGINLARVGKRIATAVHHDTGLASIASGVLVFCGDNADEAMTLAVEIADALPPGDDREFVVRMVDRCRRLNAGEKVEGRIKTTERQIWQNVSDGLRIVGGKD